MPPEKGGFAFPRQLPTGVYPPDEAFHILQSHTGMSLRDWFAGQVLAGQIAACSDSRKAAGVATWCYEVADAMLAERSKKETR